MDQTREEQGPLGAGSEPRVKLDGPGDPAVRAPNKVREAPLAPRKSEEGTAQVASGLSNYSTSTQYGNQGQYGTPAQYNECAQFFLAPTDLSGANPDPDKALSDGPNAWPLGKMEALLEALVALDDISKRLVAQEIK